MPPEVADRIKVTAKTPIAVSFYTKGTQVRLVGYIPAEVLKDMSKVAGGMFFGMMVGSMF